MKVKVNCLSSCYRQHQFFASIQRTDWYGKWLQGDLFRVSGFTLIELVVAAAIVAILAAIALPTYTQYAKRAHRADAKTALLNNAQWLERNFTESNLYHKTDSDADGSYDDDVVLPHQQSPSDGAAVYTISASTINATAYTLTATPVNPGPMAGDACGSLTLTHVGQKGSGDYDGDSTAGDADDIAACWNK